MRHTIKTPNLWTSAHSEDSAFAQSDQNLHCVHFWIAKNAKLLHADNEEWSDCEDAHADFSLRGGRGPMSQGTFSYVEARHFYYKLISIRV